MAIPAALVMRRWGYKVGMVTGLCLFGAATSELRLNFAQAFNPAGTILGMWIGRQFILSGVEKTPEQVAAMKAVGMLGAWGIVSASFFLGIMFPTIFALG